VNNLVDDQELHQFIDFTPFKGVEPVFRGTNIRVTHVLDDFCDGLKHEDILKQHPKLTEKHIEALFVFCRASLKENDYLRVANIIGMMT
jgi:uncharacterized protein (DUF433 family)